VVFFYNATAKKYANISLKFLTPTLHVNIPLCIENLLLSGLLAWSCWSYVLEGNLGVLIWSDVLKNYIYITELSIRLESGVEWSLRVKFRLLIGSDAIEKIYT
jgi:hypothetical protein